MGPNPTRKGNLGVNTYWRDPVKTQEKHSQLKVEGEASAETIPGNRLISNFSLPEI